MRAISLFTGAGGLDLGCERAGFKTVAAVEVDRVARGTLLANAATFFPELTEGATFSDITTLDVDELLEAASLERGEADLVVGGPPCTPFSKSGYWLAYKRAGADPKASLLDEYVRVVDEVQPKAYLMENVYGLAYRNQNRAVFERFMEGIDAAGYTLSWRVLLAADYGVPQLRQRLVCVGVRRDLADGSGTGWQFDWPEPTHSGPHETRKSWSAALAPHVTAGEALADLSDEKNPSEPEEFVGGTYAEELRAVPPGANYLWWTAERGHPSPRFKWRSRYWSFLLKLSPDRPAPTIQGQPGPWVGPFHWDSRRLRVAELKRLMTFPDAFVVLGSRRERQLQLGNAVPPNLGWVVASRVADELSAGRDGFRARRCVDLSGLVGITIPAPRLRAVLERAVEIAESDTPVPDEWLNRTERIGQSPSRAYVAALGTALLAKAADNRVDALAVKASAGPTAYSMRGVVKVLVERADLYGYHLGVTRGEPLNAQPFFRVRRIDEPAPIKKNARPFFRDLTRYLIEADGLTEDEALFALAAFLRSRIAYARALRDARVQLATRPLELPALVGILEYFLNDDPEEGRRGQALAAAVLDLLHEDVELAAINDPTPLDVRVLRDEKILMGVEVKQKVIAEHDGLDLAQGVATAGADKALLLALAANQPGLSVERVRRAAADAHGVLTVTYQGVMEFVTHAAALSRLTAAEFAERLPEVFLRRMQEQQVSAAGQQHWADLVAGLD